MKNTLFFDSNFNFLLLENEENEANSIWLKFHTSAAGSQVLHITANGTLITENLASDTDIVYELEDTNWTNNGATGIWLTNANISSSIIKIIFSEIPEVSCAINRTSNTVFVMQYEGQAEEESGGGSGGSGSAGTSFDFVETIRNIGFRLLDEPSAVSVEYDEINNRVEIKWTDPADIATNEPAPAEWAGTVVVRKSGSAPRHKWDGTIITDSTTRDQYRTNALIDSNIDEDATYYYGIFPYDIKGDYRYTKTVKLFANESPLTPFIVELKASEGLKYNGQNPIVTYGSMGVYDNASQSFYFENDCGFSFTNPITIEKKYLIKSQKIIIKFVGKVLTGARGNMCDFDLGIKIANTFSASAMVMFTAANGTVDSSGDTTLMRVNMGGSSWYGIAPLEASAYIGEFHEIKYELNMENGTALSAVCYVDDVQYGTKIFNTPLTVSQDNYFITFATLDKSYIKSISMEIV